MRSSPGSASDRRGAWTLQTPQPDPQWNTPRRVLHCIRQSSFCCFSDSFGCLLRSLPLARALAIPSRVRFRIRPASNSAKVARMLKNILPIASSGSWMLQPRASFTPLSCNRSAVYRASGTDLARRSSFGTTRVSPFRTAAMAWSAGPGPVGAGQPPVHIDALRFDAELGERVSLCR